MSRGYERPDRLVVIDWSDHWQVQGWSNADDEDLEPVKVRSIGWVAAEDDVAIKLINGITIGGRCLDSMNILKSDIVEMWELEMEKDHA